VNAPGTTLLAAARRPDLAAQPVRQHMRRCGKVGYSYVPINRSLGLSGHGAAVLRCRPYRGIVGLLSVLACSTRNASSAASNLRVCAL
jgi:hypothetical protein